MAAGPIIRIMCPNLKCRRVLGVPTTARGKNVRCGTCGTHVRIPAPKQPAPRPAEPASESEKA